MNNQETRHLVLYTRCYGSTTTMMGGGWRTTSGLATAPMVCTMLLWHAQHCLVLATPWWCALHRGGTCYTALKRTLPPWCMQHFPSVTSFTPMHVALVFHILHCCIQRVSHHQWWRFIVVVANGLKNIIQQKMTLFHKKKYCKK